MTESGSPGDQGAPAPSAPAPSAPAPSAPAPGAPAPGAPASAWTPPPVHTGPEGFVYGDVPNRAIAYIIDAIILGLVSILIFGVLGVVGVGVLSGLDYNYAIGAVLALVGLAISGAYFIYTWTRMRGTIGMKALGLQVGNAGDGTTLTTEQAFRRWLALGAPFSIAQAFNPFPLIGIVIALAALAWFIFLLWTTFKSPTKQGFHDVFANTMVVKATRVAA